MAINLNKYKDSLHAAWKDVLDDKSSTNWALFGYEGQSNDLKVVSKGSDGIQEMIEDLNSGKIMYAFLKVEDPKTSLPKCVLINWQGEGANTVRKGFCANHLRDVEKFFSGAHLTLNARNEDEVDPDLIIEKVSKAGSAYSFKTRIDYNEPTKPVGTNYERVNPIKEINPKERDQFWLKQEQEEKKRKEEEQKKRESARVKLEEEVKQREIEDAALREAKVRERNNSIDQVKQAEKMAYEAQKSLEKERYIDDSEVKINRSDLLRQERKKEAQDLIGRRTIDARSIFEQNTAAGQMKRTPEKPVRNSILKSQTNIEQNEVGGIEKVVTPVMETNETIPSNDEQQSDDDSDQFATIKRSPKDIEKKTATSPISEEVNGATNTTKQTIQKTEEHVQQISEQQFVDEVIYGDPGIQARALYDYQAADDTEITFDPGDIITHIELVDEGWWQGLGPDGSYGLFPANYVELI
ncbi:cortactin and drebrin [Holotrichia oblita]|uniref:Cortactin and drebrin n=1 Tax=Holotrichia oblita TaxID=644536 RepID=A0ACB9TUD2_HOLOL|nr:cortactin and drebrin [Holotrichia oblita]